ncbi:MAG: 50S ribosomal protein L25 [Deltaproteobacteria bacterium]
MNRITLAVDQRHQAGKGPARRLRAAGKVPAVVYGKKMDPIKVTVDLHEFKKSFDQAGSNPIFDLEIRDDGGSSTRTAILKERQTNPVDGALVHLDFIEVFMDVAIEVTVPLEFQGKPVGVEKGGVLQAAARELRISCTPDRIPSAIAVDISKLDIGDSVHVSDISLPSGVQVVQEETLALATILIPAREEEVVPEEEAAVEEAEAAAEPSEPTETPEE